MANPLLDFVMSLVRDPDAAAQYAADPAQAIHAANLPDVTSADVNALIPVVSESLSSAVPSTGADLLGGDAGGNVWSSGAATAAFDAFDDHSSVPVIDDGHSLRDERHRATRRLVARGSGRPSRCRCSGRRDLRRSVRAAHRRDHRRRTARRRRRRHRLAVSRRRRPAPPGHRRHRIRRLRLARISTSTTARPLTAAPFWCADAVADLA